jgi:hypothetical protein
LVTKFALPDVLALALGAGVAGTAAAGGDELDGEVDVCAIALVNAKALTAAAAMILLNMSASLGAIFANGFTVAGGEPASS